MLEGFLSSTEVVDSINKRFPQAKTSLHSLPKFIKSGRLTPFLLDKDTNQMVPKGDQEVRGKRLYFKKEEVEAFEFQQTGRPEKVPDNERAAYLQEYYQKKLKAKREAERKKDG